MTLDMLDIQCVAHMLHLMVKDPLGLWNKADSSHSAVKEGIHLWGNAMKCNKILRKVENCRVLQHRLLQDVAVRWNSTYTMQDPTHHVAARVTEIRIEASLTCAQWGLISKVQLVL